MAFPYDIDAAAVKQFNANVEILSQQKGSRLRNFVRLKPNVVGESTFIDQIGKTSAIKRTTRHADTPVVDTEWNRRKISMLTYDWGDYIDDPEQLKMLANPSGDYVMNCSFALGRALDIELIEKAFGTAYIGKEGDDSETFPAGNVVPEGGAGLTLAKMIAAKKILDGNDVDPDEERYWALGSAQIQDMLSINEFINADFNTVKALVAGARTPFGFMGFTFVPISDTILATDTDDYRRNIVWAKSGLGLAISKDIATSVDVDIKKNMSVLVQGHVTCGAARVDSDKVVEVKCNET